jgi:predicted transcriptional regulator
MSTTLELRSQLHQLIDRISDDAVLQAHLVLLSREAAPAPPDFWDELTPDQQASIDRGLADLAAGRKKPFSEIMAKYNA